MKQFDKLNNRKWKCHEMMMTKDGGEEKRVWFFVTLGIIWRRSEPMVFSIYWFVEKENGKNSFFMLKKFCTPAPFFLCSFSWKYDFGVSTRKNRRSKAEHSRSPINLHQKEEENLLGKWIDLCCLFIVGGWRDFLCFCLSQIILSENEFSHCSVCVPRHSHCVWLPQMM